MPLDALPYQAQLDQYGFVPFNHQTPNFFPVATQPVFDGAGKAVPGYLRVERGDTGDTLAIHTDKYSLMPYERHFDMFETAIAASPLGTEPYLIGTDLDANGSRIYRQYLFPDHTHQLTTSRGTRDVALRICMFDSYDGSHAFVGKSGYWDFACANTAFLGHSLADMRFKHVGDMEAKVSFAAQQLVAAAVDFQRQVSRMKVWTGVQLIAEQVDALVMKLPQANKALSNDIVSRWAQAGEPTLWGVHMALTGWSTHGDGNRKVPIRTQVDRSKRITTLVEGRDWEALAA